MKQVFFLLMIFINLISCRSQKQSGEIVVRGRIKNIPAKKVYIAEAHKWFEFLDSADCANDIFSFHIIPKQSFMPFMASISYIDSTTQKIKTLEFKNYILTIDSPRYYYNAFMVEKGETILQGDVMDHKNAISITAGNQTEALYTTQMMSFGYVDGEKKDSRGDAIKKYKKLIKEYPSSYYFFGEILSNKELYTSEELKEYLALFTPELQKSRLADILNEYIANRPSPVNRISTLFLKTDKGHRANVIDSSAKLTMLVFWASWCGPCRDEIPVIKELYNKFKNKGVAISSISIDEDERKWEGALKQEKMSWNQFIVDSVDIDRVKKEYDFSVIPFTLLIDNNGKVVARSVGFDSQKTPEERNKFLDSLLNK